MHYICIVEAERLLRFMRFVSHNFCKKYNRVRMLRREDGRACALFPVMRRVAATDAGILANMSP
jgi:hypothetical protein